MLIMGLAGTWLSGDYAQAADFFRYRLAQNLRAGHGLVYNSGDHDLLALHPLPVLLLAPASTHAPPAAVWITVLAYALAGAVLVRWLPYAGLSRFETGATLLLWLVAWPVWAGIRAPAALTQCLILGGLALAEHNRLRWAGLVAGMAALVQPEGVLAIAALGVFLAGHPRSARYWLTAGLPGGLWLIVARTAFTEGGLSDLVLAGVPAGSQITWQGALWVGLLALLALSQGISGADRRLWFLTWWAALELVAQVIVLGHPNPAYSAPLALAVSVGLVAGSRRLPVRLRWATVGGMVVGAVGLLALAPPRTAADTARDIALARHLSIPAGASIAHDRSDAFSYYVSSAESAVYRLDGVYSVPLAELLDHGDQTSPVVALAPDFLYFNADHGPLAGVNLTAAEIAPLGYREHSDWLPAEGTLPGDQLWQRGAAVGTWGETQPVQLDYGADLQLTGYALDRVRVSAEGVVRLRLDWSLDKHPGNFIEVILTALTNDGQPVASTQSRYPADIWQPPAIHTYQALAIPVDAPPGVLNVFITIGYQASNLNQYNVLKLLVPLPPPDEASLAAGNLFGTLGSVQLMGAQVSASDGVLQVDLTWNTTRSLHDDYRVFAHLVPGGDVVPAAQDDGPPFAGRYPTSLWEPGEWVPDTRRIPLENVTPGDYVVRVGLYRPEDGERLRGDQGDSISIARVQIMADGSAVVFLPE